MRAATRYAIGGACVARSVLTIGGASARFTLAIAPWVTGASEYRIDTPTAIVGVRGTVLWGDTSRDIICALPGRIAVRARAGTAERVLTAGNCAAGMASGDTTPLAPRPNELRRFLAEVALPAPG